MGSGNDGPQGPDLAAGIASAELKDGAMIEGHVGEAAVLVARIDGTAYAIGAKCTHYGGPLVQGLLSGSTVRCPWHHACFDLRTGEALLAPALNDTASYTVEEREGRLCVGGSRQATTLADAAKARGRQPSVTPESVVIVGAGAAGCAAAEGLRREGYERKVVLLDAEEVAPYDRPNLSKDYLAGNAPEEWIPLHPSSFYEENDILRVRRNAVGVNVRDGTVALDNGTDVPYGALILAPGAEPVQLDLSESRGARVHYLRSLADSRAIIASAKSAERAVVIGASFIGLEVAASLRTRGLEVHVVAPESVPLEKQLGTELGAFVLRLHEEHGVVFHPGRTARHADGNDVTLDDGTRIAADMVVVGVGVRPRVALAQSAGLAVDNGILVDAQLATEVAGVFAAGDVARFPDPRNGERIRIEHWVVAQRMGRVAAANVLGAARPFTAAPFFWSQHYDLSIRYVGQAKRWDGVEVAGDPAERDCAVRYLRNGNAVALATIGRDAESLSAEVAWEEEVRG
jgi:3-phenylpropionate/trans-cinnamate dioxygenase ferredoxin reductase subunit